MILIQQAFADRSRTIFRQCFGVLFSESCCRRFSFGRLVVNKEAESDNPWINNSEFGSAGRPLGTDPIILPLSKDLILPEALDPDSDLRFAERLRPSSEATSAQKGCQRWEAILKSMLTMTGYSLKKSPVIVLNLTSYVEDLGVSVPCLDRRAGMRKTPPHQMIERNRMLFGSQLIRP